VFDAAGLDYGEQFTRQFGSEKERNGWKYRLLQKIGNADPGCIVDGYEDASRERAPYMPALVDIAAAILRRHADAKQAREEISRIEAPRFSGLAGYIGRVLEPNAAGGVAARELAVMKRAISGPVAGDTGYMPAYSAAYHEHVLSHLRGRIPAPDGAERCAAGCGRLGVLSRDRLGRGPWYCAEHYDAAGRVSA